MEMPGISVIVWLHETKEAYFRDLLESLVSQTYDRWELYVLDQNPAYGFSSMVAEFFPEDDRAHYRQLKNSKGRAYAYNIGSHYVMADFGKKGRDLEGNYIFFVGQHDRLQPDALLQIAGAYNRFMQKQEKAPDLIYMDHDMLVGQNRMEPHFKPELNLELLRHCNYIGQHFLVSCSAAYALGEFRQQLSYACVYEYLLRLVEMGGASLRIPMLLYHERMREKLLRKEEKVWQKRFAAEHILAVEASLRRQGILLDGSITPAAGGAWWQIPYDGKGVATHQRDYMFLHEPSVRALTRSNLQKMYGHLCRKDVAVVGVRFLKGGFAMENCGFLFDAQGDVYPAFYDTKIYQTTYDNLAGIPREVSMVDFRYCMIDAKVYRKLGGLDPKLSGRDQMLDFCLRAKKAGYRTIVDPGIIVKSPGKQDESSQVSHEAMLDKWADLLAEGDPYYNPNLPMGLLNYRLDAIGSEEERLT